ncbi:MAG: 5-(carboxyamino)imidazole ribonucleotide mutase [Phototrophicales bacterium]|nr:MAG: 5-(carboxyamino)imidazole ribonucleotide mutase [Phototrophicales bacterium]
MGSKSDLEHAQKIADALTEYGISYELRIGSAHKVPSRVLEMITAYEADPRPKVYITIAGRSNALSGFTDAQVVSPVIACPPPSSSFAGADIYSSLRMPSGVAPAVVLSPENAALLAAKILGVADATIRERVVAIQAQNRDKLIQDDDALVESQKNT